MAAKKKGTGNRTTKKNDVKQQSAGKKQLMSVVWFAVAVFFLCVVFIKGQNVWAWLHNVLFGIFGITAYFYPFLLGFVAVMVALDKINGSITAKIIESGVLVALVGAAVDIFSPNTAQTFFAHLKNAYLSGVAHRSGGLFGSIIGHPLHLAFGKTGAAITVILLIFVFLMIITGTTLIALFKTLGTPVKKISEQAENAYQEKATQNSENARHNLKVIKGFDADISVDDIPQSKKREKLTLTEKQRKLVRAYNDENTEAPQGAEDKPIMEKALKSAVSESNEKEINPEEKIDFKEETRKFTDKLEKDADTGIDVSTDTGYRFPPLSLLKDTPIGLSAAGESSEAMAEHLVETLRSFGVETRIVNISRGPTVTRYELQPCAGVKISKITNLADDIALNLAAAGVRIEAPIPNKAAVGIEVPNKSSDIVGVRGIFESPAFVSAKSKLTVALGRDIGGNEVVTDIAKMPHCLIAGATGSGKSVCINTIIMSILYKATPEEVKLLMVDPKVVELGVYNGIPHLLVPVVTDPRKASGALGWAVSEMEKRYRMFADRGVRDIAGYNRFIETLDDPESEETKMPHIVIIIDELADLMMTAPKEVEDSINRIAAKARAAGMHLIIATQRPSVDVVTGVIKANIPSRIAFAVSSQIDSRTILDIGGAERLLGRGDMLFSPIGSSKPNRVQGCFVSDDEVEAVVEYIKGKHTADYDDNVMTEIEHQAAVEKKQKTGVEEDGPDEDAMLSDAIKVVVENGMASTSLLQRKLKLGYARAARIIDQMEERGIVGPYEGSKPRKVLISKEQLMEREAGEE